MSVAASVSEREAVPACLYLRRLATLSTAVYPHCRGKTSASTPNPNESYQPCIVVFSLFTAPIL
jgi:hypothetical protein